MPRVRRLLRVAVMAAVVAATSSVPAVSARTVSPFVVVQMNLCNSGMAKSCYTFGKSVDEAASMVHRYAPNLVALQEVCRDDVYSRNGWGKVAQAMADLYGSENIMVDFMPAFDRLMGDGYRCLNGEQYGVALVHNGDGRDSHHGWYSNQDRSREHRAWTCATVIKNRLTGCTTHLSIDKDVAMRQCNELMSILATSRWAMPEIIISGDFNLVAEPGQPNDVQNCALTKYFIRGDGALQQVFFTRGIQWVRGEFEAMRFTDHPVLCEWFKL